MARVSILLADDHETVREGLKAILKSDADFDVIGEAADGKTAVTQATALQPDIVLIDVSMPVMDGLHATAAIRRGSPRTRVLVLTRHADQGYVQSLLHAGAAGYVLKQSRVAELLRAIHVLAAGGTYLDPALAGPANDIATRAAEADSPHQRGAPHASVSPREEEVLRLVALGYSNKEIAAQLQLSVKTVETHKANVGVKLGLRSRIDIVQFAILRGWLEDT
jgi:DNA-binding NarL/FixJ family response regulator